MSYPEQPISRSIDLPGDAIIATYRLYALPNEGPHAIAQSIAGHFYPGTGSSLPGQTDKQTEKFAGRILSFDALYEEEEPSQSMQQTRTFIARIAIPLASIEPSIAMLVTATAGESLAFGDIRLTDLQLPDAYLEHFTGPKFGVQGVRELLNIPRRPLLLAITKPSLGITPGEGAHIIRQAAIGGADIIKDDELLANPRYSERSQRVATYAKVLEESYELTGEKTLYAVNITDRTDRLLSNAKEAIALGATALMVNYVQVGFDAVRSLGEHPDITVPVLGHNAGASSLYNAKNTGMSLQIINGLLPRLCGLDLCIFLTPHGKFRSSKEQCKVLASTMRMPLARIRPTLPVAAGGVSPDLMRTLCSDYGLDIAAGVGGAIFGHPQGADAGARAFRAAMDTIL